MATRVARCLLVLISLCFGAAHAADTKPREESNANYHAPHVSVSLIAETSRVSAREPINVGVHFNLEEGWHIYGATPGGVGLPTSLLFPALKDGDVTIRWPTEIPFNSSGVNASGYSGKVIIPVNVTFPSVPQKIEVNVKWLLCKDECIPGKATLSALLKSGALPEEIVQPSLFRPAAQTAPVVTTPQPATSPIPWFTVTCAFLGGIILNCMPCVFPILSLKIMGIVEHAHRQSARAHAVLFAFGVISSFLLLAALLIAIRAGGSAVGWGFQFQSPLFVSLTACLVFALGLSLVGVYEFGQSLQNAAGSVRISQGYMGSFMSGVLATSLATPCTAPFMGSAITVALSSSLSTAIAIFFALGLGLSFPYLLIACIPVLGKLLPRPGGWMVAFKEFLSFPLFGTVIWLLWILNAQRGAHAVAVCTTSLLLIAISMWILRRWGAAHHNSRFQRRARVSAALICGVALAINISAAYLPAQNSSIAAARETLWEPFQEELVESLVKSDAKFIVDYTAAWCLVCQVNHQRIFSSARTMSQLKAQGYRFIRADWTTEDAAITRSLEKLGKSGVPLVLLYTGSGAPVQFESIISPEKFFSTTQVLL